jgi:hypothetical protein
VCLIWNVNNDNNLCAFSDIFKEAMCLSDIFKEAVCLLASFEEAVCLFRYLQRSYMPFLTFSRKLYNFFEYQRWCYLNSHLDILNIDTVDWLHFLRIPAMVLSQQGSHVCHLQPSSSV